MLSASDHSTTVKKHDPILFGPGISQRERDVITWTSFKSGNKEAFNFIFNSYVKVLYAYGDKITKDKALVQDCIQDLFIDLWRRRESLGETDSIKFYLFKSLRRSLLRKLAGEAKFIKKNVSENDYPFAVEFSVEQQLIQDQFSQERFQHLSNALEKLSNRQREAIYLKFYQKLSSQEIADTMGIDITSCYNLISRAVESLRAGLNPSKNLFF
ncbi:RNA polymerase sigma factor [Pseudochryseolinea flava]|uniref:RNA polymerase sigma factor n=1 Tax=Pseudochryseolinea flava TaxID=2059302 RepID=UPI0014025252|nr:sigma-70 family RNA polymerase sigma factor [Pseudochryseolinea flava]